VSARDDDVLLKLDLGEGAPDEELEAMTSQLRDELLELNVDSVDHVEEHELPESAKAIGFVAIGALLVKVGPAAFGAVADTLQAWLKRQAGRKITVKIGDDTIELTGASADERRRLIDTWVAAHGEAPG
jgi:hypothetical protein